MNQEPYVYLHPLLAKEKGIQDDTMVKVFNENGEVVIRAKYSHDFNNKRYFFIQTIQSSINLSPLPLQIWVN